MSSSVGPPPSRSASSTDSGRLDVVESLYRGSAGPGRRQSALRPFEPALRPPEGSGDYSWLYRPVDAAPAVPLLLSAPEPTSSAAAETAGSPVEPGARRLSGQPAPVRRWPTLGLLTAALGCAALLTLLVAHG